MKPMKIQYTLIGHLLETVSQAACLGVELDDKLTWTPHINQVTAKSTRPLKFVRRNVRMASQSVKETAYKSLVRPALDYAIHNSIDKQSKDGTAQSSPLCV